MEIIDIISSEHESRTLSTTATAQIHNNELCFTMMSCVCVKVKESQPVSRLFHYFRCDMQHFKVTLMWAETLMWSSILSRAFKEGDYHFHCFHHIKFHIYFN